MFFQIINAKIFNDDKTKDDALLAKTFKTMEKECFGGYITDEVAVTKFKPNKNKESDEEICIFICEFMGNEPHGMGR